MDQIYVLDENNTIIETQNVEISVIGRNYFEFSYDNILIKILKNIFNEARKRGEIFSTFYRCDDDDYVKYFKLNVIPLKNGLLRLEHILTKKIKRIKSLKDFDKSSKIYKMCAWCNKILHNNKFIEMEHAINEIGLFIDEGIPRFTHGICNDCKQKLENEIKNYAQK